MVSEITRFYSQPDMTSLSVLRQGALHILFHYGFWKSDHVFLKVIHCTFYLRSKVFEILRFYCKLGMTSSWFLRQGTLHTIFHNDFWMCDYDYPIVIHSNFLSTTHGFRVFSVNWIWRHRQSFSRGCCTHFFMTDSKQRPRNPGCIPKLFCI